jgi:hypothetical protein
MTSTSCKARDSDAPGIVFEPTPSPSANGRGAPFPALLGEPCAVCTTIAVVDFVGEDAQ